MVTVKKAWVKRGYSRTDHLNGSLAEFIGREFRSVGEAQQTIYRASVRHGSNATKSPIGLVVILQNGSEVEI